MNIKSLLLGSATALVAASGARAADAVVVAEPEPVEYVRICDVYGAGFYYIPGTETCLKVGGYLRHDIRAGRGGYGGLNKVLDKMGDGEHDTYYQRTRAAVQLDARSETELGTLRAYMHLNFNYDTVAADRITGISTGTAINHAFIELGGFRVGKTDSLFATLPGYAGAVLEDDLIPYAGAAYETHQIVYTYKGDNGFSASVGVEEGSGKVLVDQFRDGARFVDVKAEGAIDSYLPHLVAGAAYTQGWGGISGVVGYDSVWEEWTGKVRLDVNASDAVSLFIMAGYGTDKNALRNFYKGWGGNWAIWGGGTVKLSKQTSLNAQVSYAENKDVAVVANVAYSIVPGFKITPEVAWTSYHSDITKEKIRDGFGGMVRFQRSF